MAKPTNYDARHIKVLKGVEGVRKNPGMYIGDPDSEVGLHHMVYEVLDNSVDEALGGFCNKIKVILHKDDSITVSDNGRGIPVDMHEEGVSGVEIVLTQLHAGGKFDASLYKVSGGLHGVGVSVVCALSEQLTVEVCRNKIYRQRYEKGVPKTKLKAGAGVSRTGTSIRFKPDTNIFKKTKFSFKTISARLQEIAFLNAGLSLSIIDERLKLKKKEDFKHNGGISEFVAYLNENKQVLHRSPIFIKSSKGDNVVEVALQWNSSDNDNVMCYTNNLFNIYGGTHLHGFKTGLTRAINTYVANNSKNKNALTGDDCREGLTAIVSIRMPDPKFDAQTKFKLISADIRGVVESVVNESLSAFFEEKPSVAKNIMNKVLIAAKAREAAKRARDLTKKKNDIDSMSLAGKLASCQSRDPKECEIFLTEGDSAGGSCKMGRDRRTQAILPLRGKILNVEKCDQTKMLKSEEVRNIISALNIGIGKDLDLSKLKYHKVVILCDADVDGHHITCLLLTFFYRYMKELIEKGHLYIAQAPLYKFRRGKSERYVQTERDLGKLLIEGGTKDLVLKTLKGEIKGKNLRGLCELVQSSKEILELIGSDRDLKILEALKEATGINKKILKDNKLLVVELKKLNVYLKKKHKGVKTKFFIENGSKYYSAIIRSEHSGKKYETIINKELLESEAFNQFVSYRKKIAAVGSGPFEIIDAKEGEEMVANTLTEVLEIIRTRGSKGIHIQRYKGLGEMNPGQLWETTLDPKVRTLLQLKIEDAANADNVFELLMGGEVPARKKFIEDNALNVRTLDV